MTQLLSKNPKVARRLKWLQDNWKPVGQLMEIPRRTVATIDEFGSRKENQDGRGIKSGIVKEVETTLRHIKSAVKKYSDDKDPLTYDARVFLKSLSHARQFEELEEIARQFAGAVQKRGKREARRTLICKPKEHVVGNRFGRSIIIRRICSREELRSVGRQLELCVAHNDSIGRMYEQELITLEKEFWAVEFGSKLNSLLSVENNGSERQVSEFEGENGCDPELEGSEFSATVLRRILRCLDADGYEHCTFLHVGAFKSLIPATARSQYQDVTISANKHEGYYRVWRFQEEIIVARTKRQTKALLPSQNVEWSHFVRDTRDNEWDSSYHSAMSLNVLFELMIQSPEMNNAVLGWE